MQEMINKVFNEATYFKKTICKKCFLKDYYAKRKN